MSVEISINRRRLYIVVLYIYFYSNKMQLVDLCIIVAKHDNVKNMILKMLQAVWLIDKNNLLFHILLYF